VATGQWDDKAPEFNEPIEGEMGEEMGVNLTKRLFSLCYQLLTV
jgi:hypothetical protein